MIKPDFEGGSIVNLMATLEAGLGGTHGVYSECRQLSSETVRAAHRVVLLLVDGLGDAYLKEHAPRLARRRRASLTSVFPSATAPAISCLMTGVAPRQHAVTGWFSYLRELGCVCAMLPFRPRCSSQPLTDVPVGPIVGSPPFFDRLDVESVVISPANIKDSAYNTALAGRAERRGYDGLAQCMHELKRAVTEPGPRRYVYAYIGSLDAASHEFGCHSREAVAHLREIEAQLEQLIADLAGSDCLLLVTADHGFVDLEAANVHSLGDHPELEACLSQPLSGEPRAAFCHVRPDCKREFQTYANDALGSHFEVLEPRALLEAGWFGLGDTDPRLFDRLGDWILTGKNHNILIDRLPNEKPWHMIGVHGGTTEAEMFVPLLVSEC